MMFSARPLTLFFTLSLILAAVADAHLDSQHARHAPAAHRMLKKRALLAPLGVDNAAAPDRGAAPNAAAAAAAPPPTDSAVPPTATASQPPVLPPSRTPVGSPAPTQSSPPLNTVLPPTSNGGLLPSIVTDLFPAPSIIANASSSIISLSSTPLTSSIPSTTSTLSTPTLLPETPILSQVTVTSSSTETPTATASTSSRTVTKLQRNTIIILIAIGASIGAAGLIWTIIRKWKFRPSSSFEDRMQPIDWQPTTGGDRDLNEKLGRSPSVASHGSFTSGNHNHDHVSDLPQHDFTAGAAHLAPVGGYADLQRGPSPQPDLHAGPNYRSPSPYHYDVPNPHGQYNAGGYQGGYDSRGY